MPLAIGGIHVNFDNWWARLFVVTASTGNVLAAIRFRPTTLAIVNLWLGRAILVGFIGVVAGV